MLGQQLRDPCGDKAGANASQGLVMLYSSNMTLGGLSKRLPQARRKGLYASVARKGYLFIELCGPFLFKLSRSCLTANLPSAHGFLLYLEMGKGIRRKMCMESMR